MQGLAFVVDQLGQTVMKRDQVIAELQQQVSELQAQIITLGGTPSERETDHRSSGSVNSSDHRSE